MTLVPKSGSSSLTRLAMPQLDSRGLGEQVRALRRSKKLTLDDLANKSGIHKGHLSRIERGQKSPSLATVMNISKALSVSLGTLFGEQVEEAAIHVVRAKSRRIMRSSCDDGAYPIASLSKLGENNTIESFLVYPPKQFEQISPTYNGEEVLFVLQGRIEVSFADRDVQLALGDYLQFPAHLQHRIRRLTSKASYLVVVARI